MAIDDVILEIRKIADSTYEGIKRSEKISKDDNNSPYVQIGALEENIIICVEKLNKLADRLNNRQIKHTNCSHIWKWDSINCKWKCEICDKTSYL